MCLLRGQPARLMSLLSRKYQESSAPGRVTPSQRKMGEQVSCVVYQAIPTVVVSLIHPRSRNQPID
jgi:hypothetical protein